MTLGRFARELLDRPVVDRLRRAAPGRSAIGWRSPTLEDVVLQAVLVERVVRAGARRRRRSERTSSAPRRAPVARSVSGRRGSGGQPSRTSPPARAGPADRRGRRSGPPREWRAAPPRLEPMSVDRAAARASSSSAASCSSIRVIVSVAKSGSLKSGHRSDEAVLAQPVAELGGLRRLRGRGEAVQVEDVARARHSRCWHPGRHRHLMSPSPSVL